MFETDSEEEEEDEEKKDEEPPKKSAFQVTFRSGAFFPSDPGNVGFLSLRL